MRASLTTLLVAFAGASFALCAFAHRAGAAVAPPAHHHDMGAMKPLPTGALPDTSLYQLHVTLESSSGAEFQLAGLAGKPMLVTMFYSQCTSVCPLLTSQLQQLVAGLSPADRARLDVLMVSFDSARDTPKALAAFALQHRIRIAGWRVARGSAHDVRTLAAALGIQYRELPDHSFNHSAVITLLDAQGVPRARTQVIAGKDPAFLSSIVALLGASTVGHRH
ncbi:MAG: hypothetical protein RL684_2009 [Pseudomonadota bacterium]|jgi:protein SCO1/2